MISILMPIYNGGEFMKESIPSILEQSFTQWELILGINGHEPDSSLYKEACKWNDPRIKVYDMRTKGKADTLNEMLKYCSYEWVALLDVDDLWLPRKLESQLPFMKEYDVIGTHCQYFGERFNYPVIPFGDLSNYSFTRGNPIINSSCLLKKNLCAWDNRWNGVEDYDLWLSLWKLGRRFYNVETVQVMHRIHAQSAFNAKGNHLQVHALLQRYNL